MPASIQLDVGEFAFFHSGRPAEYDAINLDITRRPDGSHEESVVPGKLRPLKK